MLDWLPLDNLPAFAGGGASSAFVLGLIQLFLNTRQEKQEERLRELIDITRKSHYEINNILNNVNCSRVLILRTAGKGEVLSFDKDVFSSILFEVFDGKLTTNRKNWNDQKLDSHYKTLMNSLTIEKFHKIETERMPDGILKNLYEVQGIIGSIVYPILLCRNDKDQIESIYYLSLNYTSDIDDPRNDAEFSDFMRSANTNLRNLMIDLVKVTQTSFDKN